MATKEDKRRIWEKKDKIFCHNFALKCIALEGDLVEYCRKRPWVGNGDIELKLCSISNEFNKIAIILNKISQNPSEE